MPITARVQFLDRDIIQCDKVPRIPSGEPTAQWWTNAENDHIVTRTDNLYIAFSSKSKPHVKAVKIDLEYKLTYL